MRMRISMPGINEALDSIFKQERKIVKKFSIILFKKLVKATPVDTGTARASWDIAPNKRSIKKIEYGNYSYPIVPSIPKTEYIVIGSKNKYLQFLNEGWSSQAPSLFVEQAVEDSIREML